MKSKIATISGVRLREQSGGTRHEITPTEEVQISDADLTRTMNRNSCGRQKILVVAEQLDELIDKVLQRWRNNISEDLK